MTAKELMRLPLGLYKLIDAEGKIYTLHVYIEDIPSRERRYTLTQDSNKERVSLFIETTDWAVPGGTHVKHLLYACTYRCGLIFNSSSSHANKQFAALKFARRGDFRTFIKSCTEYE